MKKISIGIAIILTVCGCEKILFESNYDNSPTRNFHKFWSNIDSYYSFFEHKEVDWFSVYDQYYPLINENSTDTELFVVLEDMMRILQDGHTSLIAPNKYFWGESKLKSSSPTFNWLGIYTIRNNYLKTFKKVDNLYSYGVIKDFNIGYLWISNFSGSNSRKNIKKIDDIIEELSSTDAIIIDVRNNSGGFSLYAQMCASRFIKEKKVYQKYRIRNGKKHNDFTPWIDETISPSGNKFTKPVVVLTNFQCASSTEDFLYAISTNQTIVFIGDTTAGSTGNPIYLELPNGWKYRFSHWQYATPNFELHEDRGFIPSIPVWITKTDSIAGIDTILETAIEYLIANISQSIN